MNKVEFIKECATRGYCNKQQAKTYCKKHDVEKYDNPNYEYCPINGVHGRKITPRRPYYE